MKFIKSLALIVFFFLSMIFFVQNTETLTSQIVIKLQVFKWDLVSPATPLYLLVLLAFALGSSLTVLFFLAERVRLASLARSNRKNADKTHKQLEQTQSELENLKKVKAEEDALRAEEANRFQTETNSAFEVPMPRSDTDNEQR